MTRYHSSTETVSELAAVSEGEGGPDDGPEDGEDIGGHMDVRLEDRDAGVVHGVEQRGQSVPHGEDGECIPEQQNKCHICYYSDLVLPPYNRGNMEHDIGCQNPKCHHH